MKRFNICCYSFDTLTEFELDFVNNIEGIKIGFYIDGGFNPSLIRFPCYYIADLCGEPGINLCTDVESLYIAAQLSNKPRYFLLNDFKKTQNIKYSIFQNLLQKESIISHKHDILYLTEQILHNKANYVSTKIEL